MTDPTNPPNADATPIDSPGTESAARRVPPPGATPPPAGEPAPGAEPAPGLREQIGRTRGAATRLVKAHVDLGKAELGDILANVKRLSIYLGVAISLLLFAGMLASIGSILWVGEWWFGSMGWGVLLGTELFVAISVSLVLVGLGTGAGGQVRAVVIGLVVGVVVAVLLGLNLPNRGWTALADSLRPNVAPEWRILALAVPISAIVLGVLGFLGGLLTRRGIGGAFALLVLGAILGALLGGLSAISFSPEVAAAIGVAVGLAIWTALGGAEARKISFDDLKSRFYPAETIDTTKETIEWVRERTPLGRKS